MKTPLQRKAEALRFIAYAIMRELQYREADADETRADAKAIDKAVREYAEGCDTLANQLDPEGA